MSERDYAAEFERLPKQLREAVIAEAVNVFHSVAARAVAIADSTALAAMNAMTDAMESRDPILTLPKKE